MLTSYLEKLLLGKRVLILGYGREGQSTYNYISKKLPDNQVTIADKNKDAPFPKNSNVSVISGDEYLESINDFDIIFKTPGISLKNKKVELQKIYSQTSIFFELFKSQIIGITGTKGKSTTASLLYQILKAHTENTILTGNIGVPAFDSIENINSETLIVFELSSHQLEYVNHSPHISILLNIFQEHLDHYNSYKDYQKAKINISKFQESNDFLIYNSDDAILNNYISIDSKSTLLPLSTKKEVLKGGFCSESKLIALTENFRYELKKRNWPLKGVHNYYNILSAMIVAKICGVNEITIENTVANFKGLEHRMEYIGNFRGIDFYNDSIATIPEATIAAIKAIDKVDTIILGGFDRGIDYESLVNFIESSKISNVLLISEAGKRMKANFDKLNSRKKIILVETLEEVIKEAVVHTTKSKVCLLSPAAASYGMFKDFADRGKKFRHLVEKL